MERHSDLFPDSFPKSRNPERLTERTSAEELPIPRQADREPWDHHVERKHADAAAMTEALTAGLRELDNVLVDALAQPPFGFSLLRTEYEPCEFVPSARLVTPAVMPHWDGYRPFPSALDRLFPEGMRRALRQARVRFDTDTAELREAEQHRQDLLAAARAEHDAVECARQDDITKHNTRIDELERQVRALDPEAVADYFARVLEAQPLPGQSTGDLDVSFSPDSRKLFVVRLLPDVDVIPHIREYRYVPTRDEIVATTRTPQEIRTRYADLVARLVLRTMRDVFEAHPRTVVDEVVAGGHARTRDKATGRPDTPCLVSVSATRKHFSDLVLDRLDPAECLRHLDARMSPHPWDLEAVRPIYEPDLSGYRTTTARDAVAELDARPALVRMSPSGFEHLVRQLFEAMGMRAWATQTSHDDGIDAVAVNEDPVIGGLCVVQAKRYRAVVPAEAVRSLAGAIEDNHASRGVLVTISWFGRSAHEFARRNGRIQLIEGVELKHLLAEHLSLDAVVGTSPHT